MLFWRTSGLSAHVVRQWWLSGCVGAMVAASLAGCGAADDEHSPAPAGDEQVRATASVSALAGEAGAPSGTCPPGVVRECKVMLGRHGDVQNCFVGVQQCSDDAWGPCLSPDDL